MQKPTSNRESGSSLVEYAVVLTLIGLATLAALTTMFSVVLNGSYQSQKGLLGTNPGQVAGFIP